jgi:tRNA(adenine34) deaminase
LAAAGSHDIDMSNMKEYYSEALRLAKRAAVDNEVPIGAIVVDKSGAVIGRGYNRTNGLKDGFQHAEIRALRQAQKRVGDWRLDGATVYVTLEPCLMCLGALLLARVKSVRFILADPTFGSLRKIFNQTAIRGAYKNLKFYHDSELEWEVKEMMRSFFQGLRKRK